MRFSFHKIETLPRLAWCASMKRNSKEIDVFHGPWVETRESFFIEGAWDGSFAGGNFDTADAFMGTGGKIVGDNVIFATPCHVLERLYAITVKDSLKDSLFLSPSLVFLLKIAKCRLDINYIPYQVDLLKMILKMDNHIGSIPTEGGNRVYVYHYRNLEINSKLEIRITNKKEPPDFKNFELYKRFLIEKLISLHNNANSPDRKITYSPLSMLSSGYDSPACTVIAMEIGCKDAVSFRTARPEKSNEEGPEDSGKRIADILGINIKEYDRLEVLRKKGMPEAEFVASGDLGQDFEISILEDILRQKLVIVGYHGDVVWKRYAKDVKKDIIRHEYGGAGWIDFKFRVGYIFVPLPFVGCLSHPSIHKITISKEMEPWCVWTNYDRPIARQIVEEKGVDRNLFGQHKKAISVLLNHHEKMLSRMNPQSAQSFEKFYQTHKQRRSRLKQIFYNVMYSLYRLHLFVFAKPNHFFDKLNLPLNIPAPIPDRFTQSPGRPSFLVHWGTAIIENRYEIDNIQ